MAPRRQERISPPFSSNYTFNVKITVYGICLLDGIPTEGFFSGVNLVKKTSHKKT